MITTDFLPGSPCWVELSSPDVEAAAEFYRELFGWEAASAGPDTGGYVLLRLDGAAVGGLGPMIGTDRPAWTVFFNTLDAGATERAVEGLGGTVVMAPMDVMGLGQAATFLDPLGARFSTWQPGMFAGMEVADQPGGLCWVSLWTPDEDSATGFYAELFGWAYQVTQMPGSVETFSIAIPAGAGEERAHGGIMPLSPGNVPTGGSEGDWYPVFAVTDCDGAVARIAANGGRIRTGPDDIPGTGRLAVCADPFGAEFIILTPSPD